MTRITFQFIPLSVTTLTEGSFTNDSDWVRSVESLADGLKRVHLENGATVEYDIDGTLRYSENVQSASTDILDRAFRSAIDTLQQLSLTEEGAYGACLILNGHSVVSQYIESVEEFREFGSRAFDNNNPEYTELSGQSIKLSLSRGGRVVTF